MGAKCGTCGQVDSEGIKTAIIRKYMMNQIEFRKLIKLYGSKEEILSSVRYEMNGRNKILQELMEEFGLRKDIKKPLRPNVT